MCNHVWLPECLQQACGVLVSHSVPRPDQTSLGVWLLLRLSKSRARGAYGEHCSLKEDPASFRTPAHLPVLLMVPSLLPEPAEGPLH